MTRALITGVTGCVGSNLAAALNRRGIDVVGLCQPGAPTIALRGIELERISGDILDPECLRRAMRGVDWMFHAAAIADDWKYKPEQVYRVNVEGTQNVLAAAAEAGVQRFILTCSAAVLGLPRPGVELLDENTRTNLKPAAWVYAHSKLLAEEALMQSAAQGLHAVSLLPTAILGPADTSMIGGQLITRMLARQPFPFPQGGVNYIDVRDVAEAHIAAAERGRAGERYLLGGHNLSHLHYLGAIGDAIGLPVRYMQVPRAALPLMALAVDGMRRAGLSVPVDGGRVLLGGQYMYYDNRKAVRELGLQPRPFAQTVEDTYRWYLEHGYLNQYRVPARWFHARAETLALGV
jgi:dihydroflavonol-4-reductase